MIHILNIETATKNCSVSISKNGKIIACKQLAEEGYSHAEKLHVFIEEILQENNLTVKDINAIAVSQGPGSYTGLRIGVSSAKGLSYSLDIPLISVDTLESLANQIEAVEGLIIPMIDARRMEVFCAVFDGNKNKIQPTEAKILDENSFSELTEKVYFIGDSNEKAKEILTKPNFVFLDNFVYPSANEMGKLSFEKYQNKNFEDVAYFEPFYLKDFMITTKTSS